MTLIQYVIVRADLMKVLKWPIGAVITQACHAVAAVNEMHRNDDELTKDYLSPANLDRMHKCVLAIPDQDSIEKLHRALEESDIKHYFWLEQPENIPTCIAVKPYNKEDVQEHFKTLKLMR